MIYEEDALAAVPHGPIEPVPCFGLTMRENWLPTQLQASFVNLIQSRVVGSLTPATALRQPVREIANNPAVAAK